jgi:O-antigen/teichoic acid export membrane protein
VARRWLVAGGGALLIALAASLPIAHASGFDSAGPLALTCVAVFLGVEVGLARGVLRSLERYHAFAVNTVAEAALRLGGVFVAMWLAASATGALVPMVGGLLAALALAHLQLAPRRRQAAASGDAPFDPAGVVAFTVALFALAWIDGALHNVDVLWVKLRFDAHDSGVYGAAAAVTRLFGVVATPLTVLALPALTIQHERRQGPGPALARICGYLIVVSALPLAILAAWPERVVDLLFGRDFRDAAPLLFPHGASVVVGYLSVLIGQAFAAIGRFRFLWLSAAGLALEVALLAAWSSSLREVALAVLAAKLVILVALAAAWMRADQPTSS